MNPVMHVWGYLFRLIWRRLNIPMSTIDLLQMAIEKWGISLNNLLII